MLLISLLNSLNDAELVEYALKHNLNFAIYRLPDDNKAHIIVSEDILTLSDANTDGYIIAPFKNDVSILIPEEYKRTIYIKDINATIGNCAKISGMPARYHDSINKIVCRLKSEGGKTVFATAHHGHCSQDLLSAFLLLADTYKHTYIYCWKLADEQDAWLGATPELLLDYNSQSVTTVALAGTRSINCHNMPWDAKNIEEQAIVTEFIKNAFLSAKMSPVCQPTYTKQAGNIEHICTEIKCENIPSDINIFSLANTLSPTPAVSGYPRRKAIEEINALEGFDRKYYGGFSGISNSIHTQLFVTLRCMSVNPQTGDCILYAGGGITANSEPESEWLEVSAKVKTLANVLAIELK